MEAVAHSLRCWVAAPIVAGVLSIGSAAAVELDTKALIYQLPDQLKWRDPLGTAGVNQAILQGDPTKPGLYVVLNRFRPGNFSRPHFHPNDRFITVVKGTWWVATGNKFDTNNMVPMPTGSFVTHYGKQVHWDGAKDEEAWVLIVGEGPATTTRVEEAKE
jgi:quercetin dioxygenase-like cupin family protein